MKLTNIAISIAVVASSVLSPSLVLLAATEKPECPTEKAKKPVEKPVECEPVGRGDGRRKAEKPECPTEKAKKPVEKPVECEPVGRGGGDRRKAEK